MPARHSPLLTALKIIWASPYSLLGLAVGVASTTLNAHVRYRAGVLEFWGPGVQFVLQRLPVKFHVAAITLGHVILGRTSDDLVRAGDHERVHVRQYETWGPFFGPAYLLASLYLWLRRRDAYHDNPFEVAAYQQHPC